MFHEGGKSTQIYKGRYEKGYKREQWDLVQEATRQDIRKNPMRKINSRNYHQTFL